jgi:hypothetical protein
MNLWTLLVIYQLKHFLADFPLQGQYMLGKFKGGTEWVLPLGAHALVHLLFTAAIVLACGRPELLWLASLDFGVHFCVDRLKASPRLGGRWKPTQPYFWWALGADQMAHHLTHYFIIWRLLA